MLSRLRRAIDRLGPTVRSAVHLRPAQIVAFARQRTSGPARTPVQSRATGCDRIAIPEGYVGISPEGTLDDDGAVRLVGHGAHDPLRFGWDAGDDPLWAYTLHYHGWISAPGVDVEVGRATMLDWIEEHRAGVGWEPYPTSLRLLHWIGWLAAHGGSLHAAQQELVLASMSAQLQHLVAHAEVHIDGNHLWTNAVAIAATSLALDGPVPSGLRESATTRLLAIVHEQLAGDAVHGERTPSYHCLLTEQLVVVAALAEARLPRVASQLRDAASRMRDVTAAFTHPDGDVALWGDSQRGSPVTPMRLFARDGLPMPTGHATADLSGFARRAWGRFTLLFNRGGVGLPHQVGHIHGDCLSIELSLDDTRVLVDAGVGTYIEGEDRRYARSTAGHNTVCVDGRDQHELWKSHRIGGRARLGPAIFEDDRLVGQVTGFRSTVTHRREIRWVDDTITITDSLEPGGRGVVRWFVPAELRVRLGDDGAVVFGPRGSRIELRIDAGVLRSSEAPGWTAMGKAAPRTCLWAEIGDRPVVLRIRAQ